MTTGMITALYAGLLGLLLVYLSARVIMGRQKHRVDIGDGGQPALARAIRTQGNFTEYVPLALLLILVLEVLGTRPIVLHGLGLALVLARLAHLQGFGLSKGTSGGRTIGAAVTFGVIIVASVLALLASYGVKV